MLIKGVCERKADVSKFLTGFSLNDLLSLWEDIDKRKVNKEIITVRGLIMDELYKRNPDAYIAWIMDERPVDISPKEFF